MAIVLVAALVVPLSVIPGTFGFESWPSSPGERVTEPQVRLDPPRVATVPVRPSQPQQPAHRVAPVPRPAARAAVSAPTSARYVPAPRVTGSTPRRTNSGSRPAHQTPSRPGRPTQQQASPEQPQPQPQPHPQPQQPSSEPEPAPELVAGEDAPMARQDPAAQPATPPPPPPVVEVPEPEPAPLPRVVPSNAPCEGHGRGHGHGHNRG